MSVAFRKYFFALLVLVYTGSAIGMPVYKHYCSGELESVSLLVKENSCCSMDEDKETDSCCKNESSHIHLQQNVVYPASAQPVVQTPVYLLQDVLLPLNAAFVFSAQPSFTCFNDSSQRPPPPDSGRDILCYITTLRI